MHLHPPGITVCVRLCLLYNSPLWLLHSQVSCLCTVPSCLLLWYHICYSMIPPVLPTVWRVYKHTNCDVTNYLESGCKRFFPSVKNFQPLVIMSFPRFSHSSFFVLDDCAFPRFGAPLFSRFCSPSVFLFQASACPLYFFCFGMVPFSIPMWSGSCQVW